MDDRAKCDALFSVETVGVGFNTVFVTTVVARYVLRLSGWGNAELFNTDELSRFVMTGLVPVIHRGAREHYQLKSRLLCHGLPE